MQNDTATMQPPEGETETRAGRAKPGAPRGNTNRMRHGRYGLILGKLPVGSTYIRAACSQLRRQLEQAVMAERKEIGLVDAATIATAVRFERHGLLCAKWLRDGVGLTPEQKLAFSRDVANSSEKRDKSIRSLGLRMGASMKPWELPLTPAKTVEDGPEVVG